AGGGGGGDGRRFARVRQPQGGPVREKFQLERKLVHFALEPWVRAPRRAIRGGREPGVPSPAFSARGDEKRLPLLDEVAEHLARFAVLHDGPDGHRNREIRPVLPVAVVPLALAAAA